MTALEQAPGAGQMQTRSFEWTVHEGGESRREAIQREAELIAALQRGSRAAFEVVARAYQSRVYSHCLRMTGDEYQSYDLAQEVFLRVFRNIGRYEHKFAFYTWIYRITANCCIDYLRKRKREPTDMRAAHGDAAEGPTMEWPLELPDEQFCPQAAALNGELRTVISEAIEGLPEKLRMVVVLRDVEGHSYEEIGDILECSGGTVKSRLFRARSQLRETLSAYVL